MTSKTQIVELTDYHFIKIGGSDDRKFLQGQLSCNMDLLSPQRSLRGAICNLQGRVIADLRVMELGDACMLQVGPGMANIVVTTLSKYAVFSKVSLEIEDTHPAPFGLIGELTPELLKLFPQPPEDIDTVCQTAVANLIRVAGILPRYELWFNHKTAAAEFRAGLQSEQRVSASVWQRADIEAGVMHVDSSVTGEFTPQLLNYDLSGVIDFRKGCYTGQEIVARMFYRGSAKQRLYLASSPTPISKEDSVHRDGENEDRNSPILAFSNANNVAGETNLLLTILSTDAVENKTRFSLSDQVDAELTILPLEY